MSSPTPLVDGQNSIPDKLYFRIGEVAQLAGVEPYVLRYWETEFPQLAPKKSGTGHRLYRRKEVELVLEVKRLLYDRRYTIEGARIHLDQSRKKGSSGAKAPVAKPKADPPAQPVQAGLFGDPAPAQARVPDSVIIELKAILRQLS